MGTWVTLAPMAQVAGYAADIPKPEPGPPSMSERACCQGPRQEQGIHCPDTAAGPKPRFVLLQQSQLPGAKQAPSVKPKQRQYICAPGSCQNKSTAQGLQHLTPLPTELPLQHSACSEVAQDVPQILLPETCSRFSDTHGTRSLGPREPAKPLSPHPPATRCVLSNAASTLQTRATALASDARWKLQTHPVFEGIWTQGFALRSFLSPYPQPYQLEANMSGFFTNS